MRKGEQTRQMIIERAAKVFNTQGFAGASISDLVRETGLEKGGIYNHFGSKDQLALEAFDYTVSLIRERFRVVLEGKRHALDRLLAAIDVFQSAIYDPPVPGGCPVLNTAIEADDADPVFPYPALLEKAQSTMTDWQQMIIRITEKGIQRGELKPETDPEMLASVITCTLEGAVMVSKLYRDPTHMHRAVQHLTSHLQSLVEIKNE